jgi:transcriptional regulator with XRE-family HTH domain
MKTQAKSENGAAWNLEFAVGAKIKAVRRLRNMSCAALAQKVGLSVTQMQKYEVAKSHLSLARLAEIATVLRVEPGHFIAADQHADYITPDELGLVLQFRRLQPSEAKTSLLALLKTL